jgi:hypothetical protein
MMTFRPRYFVLPACVRAAIMSAAFLTGLPASAWSQDAPSDKPRTTVCTEQYLPVCGRISGTLRTYSNACFARAAGAEVIASGPCQAGQREPDRK